MKRTLLIEGVDTPSMCCECPCHDWDMETNRYYCLALNGEPRIFDENTKRNDCPLVEIPVPHGRLIDVDELIKQAEQYLSNMSNEFFRVSIGHIIKEIASKTPTVIEAEGGNERLLR